MMNQYYVLVITNNGPIVTNFAVGETAMQARNDYLKWLIENYLDDTDEIIGTITECTNYDI